MRKANKILMATVAILLCLVLISTSVVSGIFAKFIITKSVSTKMYFEKFDVKIEVTPDPNSTLATNNSATVKTEKVDGVLTASVTGLQMVPSDDLLNVFNVKVTGTPNVDVNFKMVCEIIYDTAAYTVKPSDVNVSGYTSAKYFMPIGFKIYYPSTEKISNVCNPWHDKTGDALEEIVMRNSVNSIFDTSYTTSNTVPKDDSNNYYYERTYTEGVGISGKVNDFNICVYTPKTFTRTSAPQINMDEISTYIADNVDSDISIKFYFSIVQS